MRNRHRLPAPEPALAPGSERAAGGRAHRRLESLLRAAVTAGASDLLLVAEHPPTLRISGRLQPLEGAALDGATVAELCRALLDDSQRRRLERRHAVDLALELAGTGRFRCNVHAQRGGLAAAIRVLPAAVPAFGGLGLPSSAARLPELEAGLVLVCGPTGSGKSTTLAALVQAIRAVRAVHILTVEEPVEYRHPPGQGVVEQIEVGVDAGSFAAALHSVLRQDPDVILVGEMRDRETMAMALTAAETGHVVLATLHTADAVQSIDRVIDVFPYDQQPQVRNQLSLTLACVLAQRLVPARAGGRVLAAEILWADDAVRHMIRSSKVHQIRAHMTAARAAGSQPMEASLAGLVKGGRISEADALRRAPHPEELRSYLSAGSGERR